MSADGFSEGVAGGGCTSSSTGGGAHPSRRIRGPQARNTARQIARAIMVRLFIGRQAVLSSCSVALLHRHSPAGQDRKAVLGRTGDIAIYAERQENLRAKRRTAARRVARMKNMWDGIGNTLVSRVISNADKSRSVLRERVCRKRRWSSFPYQLSYTVAQWTSQRLHRMQRLSRCRSDLIQSSAISCYHVGLLEQLPQLRDDVMRLGPFYFVSWTKYDPRILAHLRGDRPPCLPQQSSCPITIDCTPAVVPRHDNGGFTVAPRYPDRLNGTKFTGCASAALFDIVNLGCRSEAFMPSRQACCASRTCCVSGAWRTRH